jgi:hypothetical protein
MGISMTLEELNEMWAKDAKIDETLLGSEATKIPQLHNKYYMFYSKEVLRLRKHKAELKELEHAKFEWYTGSLAEEDMKARGWRPNPLKILRADVNKYIESDKDVINLSLKIDYHMQIANYLEDIVKQINNRNFIIKSAIDWAKFQAGGF